MKTAITLPQTGIAGIWSPLSPPAPASMSSASIGHDHGASRRLPAGAMLRLRNDRALWDDGTDELIERQQALDEAGPVADPVIETRVNGELRQRLTMDDLFFDIEAIIECASQPFHLQSAGMAPSPGATGYRTTRWRSASRPSAC